MIQPGEISALPVYERGKGSGVVPSNWTLDLDDLCAKVRENRGGERSGEDMGQIKDDQPFEWF